MANVRVCLCLLVLFVSYKAIDAEPTYESAFCSFFCDTEDDGTDDDDDDYYDILDFLGICAICSPTSSSDKPASQSNSQKPVEIVLPPSNGLNISVSSGSNGALLMNLMPWAAPAKPAAAKPEATTAAATTAAGTTAATTAATTKKA